MKIQISGNYHMWSLSAVDVGCVVVEDWSANPTICDGNVALQSQYETENDGQLYVCFRCSCSCFHF